MEMPPEGQSPTFLWNPADEMKKKLKNMLIKKVKTMITKHKKTTPSLKKAPTIKK